MATPAQEIRIAELMEPGAIYQDVMIWTEKDCLVFASGETVLFRVRLDKSDRALLRMQLE